VLGLSDDNGSVNRAQVFHELLAKHSQQGSKAQWISGQLSPKTRPQAQAAALHNSPNNPNWRQWLFWLALTGTVALLVFFALRLIKQLNLPANEP
ncbi:MAG TPA: hypothetical protein PKD17_13300, partial [Cellvibrionaceae bacterium]|nr:hypothetical protein [Cellvibrionaceae bacterium]